MAVAALETWLQLPQELLCLQDLEALGAWPLICSAWGRSVLAVLSPPGLCLSRGRPDPGLCSGALCSWSALLDSCSRPHSPLRGAVPKPLRAAPRAAKLPLHGASSSAGTTATELLPWPGSPLRRAAAGTHLSCSGSPVLAAALRDLGALS